jgi:hypothetical protein
MLGFVTMGISADGAFGALLLLAELAAFPNRRGGAQIDSEAARRNGYASVCKSIQIESRGRNQRIHFVLDVAPAVPGASQIGQYGKFRKLQTGVCWDHG